MSDLRNSLIRIAYANPEIRADILPLITASSKTAAKLDVWGSWNKTIRKHEDAFRKDMKDLVRDLVPYLKSEGLDLDVRRSWIDKDGPTSNGWGIEALLVVTERSENAIPMTKAVVEKAVAASTGLSGFARPDNRGKGWTVSILSS